MTPTNRAEELTYEVLALFRTHYKEHAVRQVGISFGQLQKEESVQLNLFEDVNKQVKSLELDHIIDKIQQLYGFAGLMKANSLKEGATGKDRSDLLGGHKR
ncbi:hypothetical protein [Enterococcus sp. DIV0086]|uniref:DinB/UmuC family translesion DNA polymerase n=1 Tax=Enterococcus sp. DIV0086 TaxID=2774655 RepID=UPI003D28E5B6